jgi:spore germination protein GerM
MSQPPRRPPSTTAARRRRGRQAGALRWPFWLALLLLVAVSAWFLLDLGDREQTQLRDLDIGPAAPPPELPAGDRAVVLVFPQWDASGYITERRRIPSRGFPEEDLRALLQELARGPDTSGAISGLPARARLLAVFLDRDGRRAVLDYSAELVTNHPGGSASELATLTSILRTVALNFPELETCRILIDGAEVETLAGHLTLADPFELRRWL